MCRCCDGNDLKVEISRIEGSRTYLTWVRIPAGLDPLLMLSHGRVSGQMTPGAWNPN